MKIVFLVKRFYTNKDLIEDKFGRLFNFPRILAENGHECIVFAVDFRNKTESSVHKNKIRFHTIPARSLWRLPLVNRVLQELKIAEADFVFSSGDSYLGYLGLLLSRRLSCKAIFDVYDDYASFGTNKLPFMRTLLRTAVRKSDLVVCASEPLRKKYSAHQKNTLLVQNGVDTGMFRAGDRLSARKKTNVAIGDTVVGYFGSIHKPRGADDLVEALRLLRAEGEDIKLLLAGRDFAEIGLDCPWIDYRGMVKQADVVHLINSCDVVTIPYKNTDLMRMTNACKLMEYIACGVPVVVSDVADYAGYFPESFDCVAEPGNPESLARAIANQLRNRHIAGDERVLSWEKLVSRLEERMKKLFPAES